MPYTCILPMRNELRFCIGEPIRTNRIFAKCIIQADGDLLVTLKCNINSLPLWESIIRNVGRSMQVAHTWTVGRPDTNTLEFSSTEFTFLEKGMQGWTDITPPEVNVSIGVPSKGRCIFQGIGGNPCTISQKLAILACLHAIVKDLVQSRQRVRGIFVN